MAKAPERPGKPETGKAEQAAAKPAVPGPSHNSATNLLLLDIALRTGSRLGRRYLERGILRRHFTAEQAKRIVTGRPLSKSLGATIVTRLAAGSIPGALLVGGGLLAKVIFDRRNPTETARAEGEKKLSKQAARKLR